MTDPTIFDGWEKRVESEADKPRRWCKCGHVEGTHFEPFYAPSEFQDGDGYNRWTQGGIGAFQCHYGSGRRTCKCTEFRPKKRKNRIKFWLTGRG